MMLCRHSHLFVRPKDLWTDKLRIEPCYPVKRASGGQNPLGCVTTFQTIKILKNYRQFHT